MPRMALFSLRVFGVLVALACTLIYVKAVGPMDGNALHLKRCAATFLAAYLGMILVLLVFTRVRKLDLGLICWLILSAAFLGEYELSYVGIAPFPHLSQGISGAMGVLAAILPLYVGAIRTSSRESQFMARYVDAKRMISPASHSTLPSH